MAVSDIPRRFCDAVPTQLPIDALQNAGSIVAGCGDGLSKNTRHSSGSQTRPGAQQMYRISESNRCQDDEHYEGHYDIDITDSKDAVSKRIHHVD